MRSFNINNNTILLNALFIFVILSLAALFFVFSYNSKSLDFSNEFYGQELQREIAFKEFTKNLEKGDFIREYMKIKYEVPDTLDEEDLRYKYIRDNPKLPDYIKKALIERHPVFLMTVGELFLALPELAEKAIIVQPKWRPNMIEVGYQEYLMERNRFIANGPIYWFKNGFLVEHGMA